MKKWGKPDEVVAQRIHASQIPGVLHKNIFLEEKEIALVIRKGSVEEELEAGKHSIKDFSEIILVDTAEKIITKRIENLPTENGSNIEIRFAVYLPEKLARTLMAGKALLTVDEIYSELYEQAIPKILEGSQKNQDIETFLKEEIKKTLQEWGIELLNFSINLDPEENKAEKGNTKEYQKNKKMKPDKKEIQEKGEEN